MVWLICNDADTETAGKTSVMMRAPLIDSHHGHNTGRPAPCDVIMKQSPPRIMNSHLPYKLIGPAVEKNKPRVIVVFRNPKDVVVSYFHFHKDKPGRQVKDINEFFEKFITGEVLFGDWFEHTRDWWVKKDDSHILALTYESMKADHTGTIEKIAAFLGKDLSKETVEVIRDFTSFDAMKIRPTVKGGNRPAPDGSTASFYRKGVVGDWKSSLSEEQSKSIDEKYETFLADIDINFDV